MGKIELKNGALRTNEVMNAVKLNEIQLLTLQWWRKRSEAKVEPEDGNELI